MTVGSRNSQIDSGFAHRTVSAIRARLAFVSETTMPILSISGIRRYWAVPSASEIAVLTLEHADEILDEGDQQDGDPDLRPERAIRRDHGMDDRDRDDRCEAELGEVERELDRALAPVEEERQRGPDEAGGDERGRRDEEEPGHRPAAPDRPGAARLNVAGGPEARRAYVGLEQLFGGGVEALVQPMVEPGGGLRGGGGRR